MRFVRLFFSLLGRNEGRVVETWSDASKVALVEMGLPAGVEEE